MRILLINPPYQTVTSNVGVGHQVPLGLLSIGGSLIDAGHDVKLLDAEALHWTDDAIVERVRASGAEVVMTGHAGSTPAHPVCMRILQRIKRALPEVITVYGGVYPTYHSRDILSREPAVDVVVRGEGEATVVELVDALRVGGTVLSRKRLHGVDGITFRDSGQTIVFNPDRESIRDLDQYRVGWELIENWDLYQCFGLGRSAIVQFSRGCPHRCTYCGQHGFWNRWRHRDPRKLADEIEWLHKIHGVKFITLADENPTTNPKLWREFLTEVAARNVDVQFFTTIRASDIVRDAEFLELYRQAGILYVLMGIDTTDPRLMDSVRKRSAVTIDQQACELLRKHNIRSIVAQIVGLGDETWSSMKRTRKALKSYQGDLLNVMYATPHTWTSFARGFVEHNIVQEDQRWWDYRHQVIESPAMKPWQVFAAVKWMELTFHARPDRLLRLFWERNATMRKQLWWTGAHIGAVWLAEIWEFARSVKFTKRPRKLRVWIERGDDAATEDASKTITLTINRFERTELISDRASLRCASGRG